MPMIRTWNWVSTWLGVISPWEDETINNKKNNAWLTPDGFEIPIDLSLPKHIGTETKWPPLPDDIFICIFLNEKVWVSLKILLKFVPKGPMNNIPSLFQIMAWRRTGDKSLSETMMVSSPTHKCVTRPQWVKRYIFPSTAAPGWAVTERLITVCVNLSSGS